MSDNNEEKDALLSNDNDDIENKQHSDDDDKQDDPTTKPHFGNCIVLTLDLFNSLSLLVGGLLLAISIYIKQMWDKGISGEDIFSHFFRGVGIFLCLVSLAGFISVRLVNDTPIVDGKNDNTDPDVIYNYTISSRQRSQKLKRHLRRLIYIVYIIILMISIVAQFFLSGILLVFLDSISKQYLTPRLSSPSLEMQHQMQQQQPQQHYSPMMKISSNLLFMEVDEKKEKEEKNLMMMMMGGKGGGKRTVLHHNSKIQINLINTEDPKTENQLRDKFDRWSKCTYTKCCEWKKFQYNMNVKCESKLDNDGNNKNKNKKKNDKDKDEKTNLPMMCKGWPVTKDVCSSGIKKFQKQSATIIEHYIQPLITFVMFNAFLQLIVMVLAILEMCTIYAQYKNHMRLSLN